MADSLSDKISKLKDEDAAQKHGELVSYHDEKAQQEAAFLLGRITQNDHIAQAVYSNLAAQSIRALERFFDEKRHEAFGYQTLVDFLEKSPMSPMSKRQYYDRLALVREHGDEIFDLLTSVGISVRSQKMLGTGELSIKGDTLYVGDKEVKIADTGVIKDVLNELFDEKRESQAREAKLKNDNEKLKAQVATGTDEFDQLQRAVDAINEQTPYERAFLAVVKATLTLKTAIEQDLDDDERAERGPADLKTIAGQYFQLSDAYGVNVPLMEPGVAAAAAAGLGSPDFEAKFAAELAAADNLDEEAPE